MKKIIFVVIIAMMFTGLLFAQTETPQINKTQKKQVARIHQGVKSGELTKAEAKKLITEEKIIRKEKIHAKADGAVTKGERKHIRHQQNKINKDIYRLKHNERKN
jgi:hypothetical protein